MRPSIRRWGASASMLLLAVFGTACEQPVRPAGPTPLELASDHFDVPVSVLVELQATAARVQPPAQPAGAGPTVSGSALEDLRRTLARLGERFTEPSRTLP